MQSAATVRDDTNMIIPITAVTLHGMILLKDLLNNNCSAYKLRNKR